MGEVAFYTGLNKENFLKIILKTKGTQCFTEKDQKYTLQTQAVLYLKTLEQIDKQFLFTFVYVWSLNNLT